MSAPSFSSFPPSFASFPDLDPGPSRLSPPLKGNSDTRGRREGSRKDKKEKSQHRSKKSKDEPRKDKRHKTEKYDSEQQKHAWTGANILDDEKLKVEEDRRLTQSGLQPSKWDSRPLFFSDRKGDQLNITYGGIHAGNIPKYHLVNRESHTG
jgi:hypothetical protein